MAGPGRLQGYRRLHQRDILRVQQQQCVSTWTLMTSCSLCSLIGCCVCKSSATAGVSLSPPHTSYWVTLHTGSYWFRLVQVHREMMKMMKMVLVLSCVLCVSADVLHQEIRLTGCSDSDGEQMYGLDGEELWYADFINKKGVEPLPSFVDQFSYQEGTYEGAVNDVEVCKYNLKLSRKGFKDLPLERDAPSSLIIYTRDNVELGEKNTLICHVTGFYPAPVKFYWTRNGENVTEGTSVNVPYLNKDKTFNQFSRLEFIPQLGDMYSCRVKHLSLEQPMTGFWDVEKTQPSIGPAVFCGLGLTVGLLGVAAGTFFLIKGNECS